jgi:hypothetical protein
MLKLTTDILDPARDENDLADYHEAELLTENSDGTVSPAFSGRRILQNRDLLFRRPDGGENVYHRRARPVIEFNIDWLNIVRAQALSDLKARRELIRVLPNFDARTILWAPLTGSCNAVARLPGAYLPQLRTVATTGRNALAYQPDLARGLLVQKAAGVPRFVPGPLGPMFVSEYRRGNTANPNHPASGNLGWNASGGPAGTPVWTTEERSPVVAGGYGPGVCRLPYSSDPSTAATWSYDTQITDADTGVFWRATVWLKGDAPITLRMLHNSFDSQFSAVVELTPHRWQPVTVTCQKTGAGTNLDLLLAIDHNTDPNPVPHGGRIHTGPVMLEKGVSARTVPTTWTSETSYTAGDDVQYAGLMNPGGGVSYAWLGKVPTADEELGPGPTGPNQYARIFTLSGGGVTANYLANWENNELVVYMNTSETARITLPLSAAGKHYYASWVLDTAAANGGRTVLMVYCEGVTYTDEQFTSADFTASVRSFGTLGISTDVPTYERHLAEVGIQHLRVDGYAWSRAEQDLHLLMFTSPDFLELIRWTHGRRWRIDALELRGRDSNPKHIVGSIRLVEVDNDRAHGWLFQD